ncbi:MAG: hypothetical protein ACREGH_01260 [Minisyncoccia bacterium]
MRRFIVLLAGASAFVLLPSFAHAIVLPSVKVDNLQLSTATSSAGSVIMGSFSIDNRDSAVQNDLAYEVKLLTSDDEQLLYSTPTRYTFRFSPGHPHLNT